MPNFEPVYSSPGEALERLNAVLPLAARQAALPAGLKRLHRAILDALIRKQRLSGIDEIASEHGEPDALYRQLAGHELVTLDAKGRIQGAYPITLADTPHRVYAGSVDVNAMCAVDALAIGPMFGLDCMIRSRCAQTGVTVVINQNQDRTEALGQCEDLHVGIHWRETGGCAAETLCREMVFLCDAHAAARWQQDQAGRRSVLGLEDAVELARDFFMPLVASP